MFASRSIARNLTATLLGLALLSAAFFSAALYLYRENLFLAGAQERIDRFMDSLNPVLGPLLAKGAAEETALACSILRQQPLVHSLRLENASGGLLFQQDSPPPGSSIQIPRSREITLNNKHLGRASVMFSLRGTEESVAMLLYPAAPLFLAALLVVSACAGTLLRLFLRRPLDALSRKMDCIASGDFAGAPEPIQHTELAPLAQRLTRMAGSVSRREAELRQAKEALDNIVNAMPSIVIGLDAACRITLWNSAAMEQTGKSRKAVMGRNVAQAIPEWAFLQRHVGMAIIGQRVVTLARDLLSLPCGEERRYTIVVHPVTDASAIVRMDDVAMHTHMEELMVRMEKMISIGGLAAGMAHEINNPLGGVLQGTQNILRRFDPTLPANIMAARACGCDLDAVRAYMEERGIQRFLEGVREAGARAASIVTTMLEFSRNAAPTKINMDLSRLVGNALDLAANTYDLKKNYDFRKIQIKEKYAPNLPKIACSPLEIEQVLLNLLKNAVQAMPQRGERQDAPCISIHAWQEDDSLRVTVSDNGPGIPKERLSLVFEPFYTTKTQGEGTGLGLSVANFIIANRHGGTLNVASEQGTGTTFTITLPLQSGQTSPGAADPPLCLTTRIS